MNFNTHLNLAFRWLAVACMATVLLLAPCQVRRALFGTLGQPSIEVLNKFKVTVSQSVDQCDAVAPVAKELAPEHLKFDFSIAPVLKSPVHIAHHQPILHSLFLSPQVVRAIPFYILYQSLKLDSE